MVRQAVERKALADMGGRAMANLLATSALADVFDPDLFRAAFGPAASGQGGGQGSAIRSATFDASDQALLAHVAVALEARAPADCPRMPVDIARHCMRAFNRSRAELQPIYDAVALALRRLQLPYQYRQEDPTAGYLLWLTLPARCSDDGGESSAGAAPPSVRGWVLEVEGAWNTIPGTAAASLEQRLFEANLQALGFGVLKITLAEWQRCAALGGAAAMDLFPEATRQAQAAVHDAWWRPGLGRWDNAALVDGMDAAVGLRMRRRGLSREEAEDEIREMAEIAGTANDGPGPGFLLFPRRAEIQSLESLLVWMAVRGTKGHLQ
jgi:hypothetical protein